MSDEYHHDHHLPGCQSTNHTNCKGELWTCTECGKTVCEEEGSTDKPDLCDDCWVKAQSAACQNRRKDQ